MRAEFADALTQLQQLGYRIAATPGTAAYYRALGFRDITELQKPAWEDMQAVMATANTGPFKSSLTSCSTLASEPNPPGGVTAGPETVLQYIRNKTVDLVINIPEGTTRSDEVTAGYLMRRTAVDFGCSLLTNIKYTPHLL